MSEIWLWMLALYGLGITVLLIRQNRSKRDIVEDELARISLTDTPPLDRIKALSEIANIRDTNTPWYQKSLSAIGVVAFFSMLIATGVQTFKGSVVSAQAERLRGEVATLKKERSDIERLMGGVAGSVIAQYREAGRLDQAGQDILRHRLEYLRASQKPDHDDIVEMFEIALILRDYASAKDLLNRHIDLLDRAKPDDLISLAEYEYLVGAPKTAQKYADRVTRQDRELPKASQIRLIVLNAEINGNVDHYVRELAAVLNTNLREAKRRLKLQMEQ